MTHRESEQLFLSSLSYIPNWHMSLDFSFLTDKILLYLWKETLYSKNKIIILKYLPMVQSSKYLWKPSTQQIPK